MKICVWYSSDAPPASAWLARIVTDGKFLPVLVPGASEAEARDKAQTFWNAEVERFRRQNVKRQIGRPKVEARPAADLDQDPMAGVLG